MKAPTLIFVALLFPLLSFAGNVDPQLAMFNKSKEEIIRDAVPEVIASKAPYNRYFGGPDSPFFGSWFGLALLPSYLGSQIDAEKSAYNYGLALRIHNFEKTALFDEMRKELARSPARNLVEAAAAGEPLEKLKSKFLKGQNSARPLPATLHFLAEIEKIRAEHPIPPQAELIEAIKAQAKKEIEAQKNQATAIPAVSEKLAVPSSREALGANLGTLTTAPIRSALGQVTAAY